MKCHISGLFTFSHKPVHVLSECVFVTLFTWLALVASMNNLERTFFNRSNANIIKLQKRKLCVIYIDYPSILFTYDSIKKSLNSIKVSISNGSSSFYSYCITVHAFSL